MLNREYKAPKPLSAYRPKRAPSLPAVPAPNNNKLTGSQSLQFTQDINLKQIIKPGISISPHKFLSLRAAGGSSSTRPASSSYSRTSKNSKGSYNSFISDLTAFNASCEQTPMNKTSYLSKHDIVNGFKSQETNIANETSKNKGNNNDTANSQQILQNQPLLNHNIVSVLKVLDENKGKQHQLPSRQRSQRNRYQQQQSFQSNQELKEFSTCLSAAQGADSSFNSRDIGLLKQNFLVGTELQSINDSKELKEPSNSKKKINKQVRQACKGRSSGNVAESQSDENNFQLLSAGKKGRKKRDSTHDQQQGYTKEETLMQLVMNFHALEESGTKRISIQYCKNILQAFSIESSEIEGFIGSEVQGHGLISFEEAMKCFSVLEGSNQEISISLMKIIESSRRIYEEDGKYGDAKRMLAKWNAIREILQHKYQETLRSKQQAELAGIEVTQREGFAEFVNVWEKYTAEYQATAYLSLQKLQERHASELTALEEETRKDLLSKFKPSKKLLEMRHQEKLLAKLKQYNQAESVQYKADFLQEAERKRYAEEVEETVKVKAAALRKLHSQAISVLLKRIEADRAHQLKQRQADSTVIMIRNRNALNEAVQRHNIELKRPHEQFSQGNTNITGYFNPNLTFLNYNNTKNNLDEYKQQQQSQRQWISGSSPSSSLADKYLGIIQHNPKERESISGSRRQRFISCKPRDKSKIKYSSE